jgi:6-phosphogluconate dehydrogenase (decarboxylating)
VCSQKQTFSSTILAKVGYALPATTFNKKECETITRNLVQVTLSKSGVNPHLPRDLFGDITWQGLGFPDLYVHQGSYKVAHFIKFISNMRHIARSLMQISYELLIIKTGCMNPFDLDYPRLQKMVSRSYLTSLWESVFEYQIKIRCNRQGTTS